MWGLQGLSRVVCKQARGKATYVSLPVREHDVVPARLTHPRLHRVCIDFNLVDLLNALRPLEAQSLPAVLDCPPAYRIPKSGIHSTV
jgi:hypothetical protein